MYIAIERDIQIEREIINFKSNTDTSLENNLHLEGLLFYVLAVPQLTLTLIFKLVHINKTGLGHFAIQREVCMI